MGVLKFKLKEAQAKYGVSNARLASELRVSKSTLSEWRTGKKQPGIHRLGQLLNAIEKLGDKATLDQHPISESVLIEWMSSP